MTDTPAGSVAGEPEPAAGEPEVLWRPAPDAGETSRLTAFRVWLRAERGLDLPDYQRLWEWSTTDLPGFWGAVAEFCDVRFHQPPERVLADETMPGARWFPGATLNYAEHALRPGAGKGDDDLAVLFHREDGHTEQLTYGELRAQVAAVRAGLVDLGVRRGDRVVALAPNCPQTLVAFLAAASLGATWSSCSPDFGARAIADRFTQIKPAVLIAVAGYRYNGRAFDVRPTVERLRADITDLRGTVMIDYLDNGAVLPGQVSWADLLDRHAGAELAFEPVPFDHPLWVLYSSGTTGLPKGIVHGHGGILLEHLKVLSLHSDLGPGTRFFWFTTTGWMMWNFSSPACWWARPSCCSTAAPATRT
jgi:acetoacetyl-CoA synthetase